MTLADCKLTSRDNNLTIIRLCAAVFVTFGHCFAMLTGRHTEIFGGIQTGNFGFISVGVFFGLSGLLITQSWITKPWWRSFMEARCLRIFPGLLFANVVTILIVGLLIRDQGFRIFFDLDHWGYLFCAVFFKYFSYYEAFNMMPINSPNGSLWTLPIEFRMYIYVMLLGIAGSFRRPLYIVAGFSILTTAILLHFDFVLKSIFGYFMLLNNYDSTLSLPLCFGIGMLAFLYPQKVFLSYAGMILALLIGILSPLWPLKVIGFLYAALVFGFHPKLYLSKLNFRNDISYGVYVLSWPVQQALIFLKTTDNPYLLFVYTMIVVTPLALVSWKFVERPALNLRGKIVKVQSQ